MYIRTSILWMLVSLNALYCIVCYMLRVHVCIGESYNHNTHLL